MHENQMTQMRTFARADEEEPIGSNRAIKQIHYWPGMAVAHQRDSYPFLIHHLQTPTKSNNLINKFFSFLF
jgi:hypothetical protein